MKTSHSFAFFVLILIAVAAVFFFLDRRGSDQSKVLLQTLSCQSDKIDASVYNLQGNTSLIGAFISFKTLPLPDEDKQSISDLGVRLKEDSQIFDYMLAEIPTDKLCDLVGKDIVARVFIPKVNGAANKK